MNGPLVWQTAVFAVPSAIGALLFLALLFVLIRKPSWQLFFFLCFYFISVSLLAGIFITSSLQRSTGTFSIQKFWIISRAIGHLRYIPLILFVHSAHRFRVTPVLTGIMTVIVGLGIVSPFLFYSLIPNLMEIIVALYAFSYWLAVYLMRARLSIPARHQGLLRAVLACSGFFLIGVILDLLEDIPQAGIYVSILLVDFYPAYLVCIGGVMVFWEGRNLLRPSMPREPMEPGDIDFTGLPVTRREREIIGLILRGETNNAIADRLFISESTVKKHINNLLRKLAINSRWELLKLTGNIHPKE